MNDANQLDAIFFALANPTRRAIVARLAEGGATVNELAAPFDMSLPAISKHIRVLEKARLIKRGRDAQFRPCELNGPALQAVVHWTDQYRHIWDARFDAMDEVIKKMGDSVDE
ncbi:ArsR/SmtB family transcription factor [Amaricoccus tamworthensis]|uniref:ArsR/SmtB family transcription factor n=1 Tax=Amaricoccus tamworthensis TaxID=57002 RepID=UPI003C7A0904